MATIIPSLNSCLTRMTPGERRFGQRLADKLEDDYLCWYNVPVGTPALYPDFTILNPRRGLLVLEVKDWRLESIQSLDRHSVVLLTDKGLKHVANPVTQARSYAQVISNKLERDPVLIAPTPVIREIFIHKATTTTESGSGPFFASIPTDLVATVSSDATGFYEVEVVPGTYSVFVREDASFYANSFDDQGRIQPVEVTANTVSELQIDITHKASF